MRLDLCPRVVPYRVEHGGPILMLAAWLLGVAACGAAGRAVRPEAQGLRVVCAVDDAIVLLDGAIVGTAGRLRDRDLPVLPGHHRVEVRADGYFSRYEDVEIPRGGRVRLEVTLRPRLPVP